MRGTQSNTRPHGGPHGYPATVPLVSSTTILVDGDHAAAELELELTSVKTRQLFPAKIAHFWSFEDGIPVHLVEYMDTALIASHST